MFQEMARAPLHSTVVGLAKKAKSVTAFAYIQSLWNRFNRVTLESRLQSLEVSLKQNNDTTTKYLCRGTRSSSMLLWIQLAFNRERGASTLSLGLRDK